MEKVIDLDIKKVDSVGLKTNFVDITDLRTKPGRIALKIAYASSTQYGTALYIAFDAKPNAWININPVSDRRSWALRHTKKRGDYKEIKVNPKTLDALMKEKSSKEK